MVDTVGWALATFPLILVFYSFAYSHRYGLHHKNSLNNQIVSEIHFIQHLDVWC